MTARAYVDLNTERCPTMQRSRCVPPKSPSHLPCPHHVELLVASLIYVLDLDALCRGAAALGHQGPQVSFVLTLSWKAEKRKGLKAPKASRVTTDCVRKTRLGAGSA